MTQKNQPKIQYTLDFDVTPHQLRHTYITNLLYAGVDPKTVQYLAGHENSKTTFIVNVKQSERAKKPLNTVFQEICRPVSYTHLDVYKRQVFRCDRAVECEGKKCRLWKRTCKHEIGRASCRERV